MAGRKHASTGRKVLWGVVGYGVTTLGTLLTTYLTSLKITAVVGSVLATTVGLVLVIVGVFIDAAKEGGKEDAPQLAPVPAWPQRPGQPYQGGYYRPVSARPRGSGRLVGVVALVLVLCGGGGLALAYGVQDLGHKAIESLDAHTDPPWETKTKEPGRERIVKASFHTRGALTVTVSSVRVNNKATIVTITAKNPGKDSLYLPVYSNALLDVPGASTLNADPDAGTFNGTVPAGGQTTGTVVFDGVLGAAVTNVTLSFAHVMGSLSGPDNIAVNIAIAVGT
jgi:hypothetical protein